MEKSIKIVNKNWINSNNFIYYYSPDLIQSQSINYTKIIIFDLDYTICKTKSGKVFPTNKDDWEFLFPNIIDTINNLDNKTIIGICSNQKGIKSIEQINDWKTKLNNIITHFNKFHFIFASLKDDRYRKPMIGSWDFIKDNILTGISTSNCEITYIGDACGRPSDHSDTDIKFAYNSQFKFKTPEQFFKIKVQKQIASISYPDIEYLSIKQFNDKISNIKNLLSNDKVFIMMIGFPASGKSFLRKYIINFEKKFNYYNKDEKKFESVNTTNNMNTTNNFIIDDNTNMNLKKRKQILDKYSSSYKIGIFFDYSIDLCMHLNYMRMYWYGHELIKKVGYNVLNKTYSKPTANEFDSLITIDKVLPQFNLKIPFKYYF